MNEHGKTHITLLHGAWHPEQKLVTVSAAVWGAGLFIGLSPIPNPDTKLEAVANGVLLQYGANAASQSLFHTTSGWLIIAGFADELDPEKVQRLLQYMRDDS